MKLLLAPMEGLLDHCLRDVLTRAGGVDRCVSEFIRVTDQLLPDRVFLRLMPELAQGSRTAAGTPVSPSSAAATSSSTKNGFPCPRLVIDSTRSAGIGVSASIAVTSSGGSGPSSSDTATRPRRSSVTSRRNGPPGPASSVR